jgi:hypothetical protein
MGKVFLANRPMGVLYVGVTNDLASPIWEHKTKLVPRFDKLKQPAGGLSPFSARPCWKSNTQRDQVRFPPGAPFPDALGRLNVATRFIIYRGTATSIARSEQGPLQHLGLESVAVGPDCSKGFGPNCRHALGFCRGSNAGELQ